MSVELLRAQAAPRIDPSFEIALLVSFLGLTLTLATLPFIGSDFGTWLALAG
jgi:hypothetical protein